MSCLCNLQLIREQFLQKNPRAHKNKIGTPPPPPKPKIPPPPPKRRNFMDMAFSCRTDAFFPGVHKIGAAISGPRTADNKNFTDTRIFLIQAGPSMAPLSLMQQTVRCKLCFLFSVIFATRKCSSPYIHFRPSSMDCQQRDSTVSKQAPAVGKRASPLILVFSTLQEGGYSEKSSCP